MAKATSMTGTKTKQASKTPHKASSERDDGYPTMERLIRKRIADAKGPLFTTDAVDLFKVYLSGLPVNRRQHYNCHCCRRFINQFGGLVTIDEKGIATPLLWDLEGVPPFFAKAVTFLKNHVKHAKVNGVFLSSLVTWGTPTTGEWTHYSGQPAETYKRTTLTAGQKMAEKREDFGMLRRAIGEYPRAVVAEAVRVLSADALDRSEKTLGVAEWFLKLHEDVQVATITRKANVVWRAVGMAPPGWCHIKTTMISTLLDDIKNGLPFEDIAKRWAEKMHPTQYQRPTTVKAGTIYAAEKMFADLGLAPALRRRYARESEVVPYWSEKPLNKAIAKSGGVFAHVNPTSGRSPAPHVALPTQTMTWSKFRREVLPTATKIEYKTIRGNDKYFGLVTAVYQDAPPLLQWDTNPRNPVSWYFLVSGSPARMWGLSECEYVNVNQICEAPPHWHLKEEERSKSQCAEMAMMILEGCRPIQPHNGSIFPECLRSDLHPVRSVVEAHARSTPIEDPSKGTANGVAIQKNGDFSNIMLRVTVSGGHSSEYRIDRWD